MTSNDGIVSTVPLEVRTGALRRQPHRFFLSVVIETSITYILSETSSIIVRKLTRHSKEADKMGELAIF